MPTVPATDDQPSTFSAAPATATSTPEPRPYDPPPQAPKPPLRLAQCAPPRNAPAAPPPADLASCTQKQLQQACRMSGQPSNGTKSVLAARLLAVSVSSVDDVRRLADRFATEGPPPSSAARLRRVSAPTTLTASPPPPNGGSAPESELLHKCTQRVLQEACRSRSMSSNGMKTELARRLFDAGLTTVASVHAAAAQFRAIAPPRVPPWTSHDSARLAHVLTHPRHAKSIVTLAECPDPAKERQLWADALAPHFNSPEFKPTPPPDTALDPAPPGHPREPVFLRERWHLIRAEYNTRPSDDDPVCDYLSRLLRDHPAADAVLCAPRLQPLPRPPPVARSDLPPDHPTAVQIATTHRFLDLEERIRASLKRAQSDGDIAYAEECRKRLKIVNDRIGQALNY